LWVTIHQSDDEAHAIWVDEIGFDLQRLTRLGDEDNFWAMGDTGPCGPCSEIFYDHGPEVPGGPPGSAEADLDRYVEIWNLVFPQYERSADGTLTPLTTPGVDTGMGLERVSAVLQGVHDNYDIDTFKVLIERAAQVVNCSDLANPSLKVIADHIRSTAFLIADGVLPSNEGRGYVVRRIIRRAIRHGHKLQAHGPFFHKMVETLVKEMGDAYPILEKTRRQIEKILLKEEQQFEATLDQGMRILTDAIDSLDGIEIPGEVVFRLYDTYGFPTDLTADIARERNLTLDMAGFDREMQVQRERARAASKFSAVDTAKFNLDMATGFIGYESLSGQSEVVALFIGERAVDSIKAGDEAVVVLDRTPFYAESGGQVGDTGRLFGNGKTFDVLDTQKAGEAYIHKGKVLEGTIEQGDTLEAEVDRHLRDATRLNHSATHLLHAALRQVLGEHVNQRGSLVEPERLRFDFSHFEALSRDEIKTIERLVNEQIRRNSEIRTEVMNIEAAREKGAMALFGEKYSEDVRVLTMGNGFSVELCGGTHAARTGDIGVFRITSEQGIAAGVRRIEAVTGARAVERIEGVEEELLAAASLLRADRGSVLDRLQSLLEQNRRLEKEVARLNTRLASGAGTDIAASAVEIGGARVVVHELKGADPRTLPDALDRLKNQLGSGVVVLASVNDDKVALVAGVTRDLTDKVHAGELVNFVAAQIGGKGGGRPDMARAGGTDVAALASALDSVSGYLQERL
jgi:alanyl-tRNA synthetase